MLKTSKATLQLQNPRSKDLIQTMELVKKKRNQTDEHKTCEVSELHRTQPQGCDQWFKILIKGLTRIRYEATNCVVSEEKNIPRTEAKQESLKRINEY